MSAAPAATPPNAVLDRLLAADPAPLAGKTVFVGFDAFVDLVARPLRAPDGSAGPGSGPGAAQRVPHATLAGFGAFIGARSGRSASVELEERAEKLGGNAPILGNALAALGARVRAVGPYGLPAPHPVFAELARAGELVSVGEPGLSVALEFEDGKLMLALNRAVDRLDYAALAAVLPPDRLLALLSGCDLLAFVNWSEMPGATDLLAGLARDVLPRLPKPVPLLVDLSDCSRRSAADLRDYLDRLAALPPAVPVLLSLNRNEADRVRAALDLPEGLSDAEGVARIHAALRLDWAVLHDRDGATIAHAGGAHAVHSLRNPAPRLLTGAGDNFNAGLCAGRLAGLGPADALALAAATAAHYVSQARSASWTDLRDGDGRRRTP